MNAPPDPEERSVSPNPTKTPSRYAQKMNKDSYRLTKNILALAFLGKICYTKVNENQHFDL